MTKTPSFDAKLDAILNSLSPHSRECTSCKSLFQINQTDIEFFKILRVPSPKNCPECRMRERMTYNTSTLKFYRKDCAAHKDEKVVSLFASDNPIKVFDNDYWWNPDTWDAREYALEVDKSKNFFEQFRELVFKTPHFAIARYHAQMENSDYTSHALNCKNCYYSSMVGYCESCYYCIWLLGSKECIDCLEIENSERCARLTLADHCYNSIYLQNCRECIDCAFCYNVYNSHHCFMSANIKNASYLWCGKQLAKDEYEKKRNEIYLGKRSEFEKYEEDFKKMYQSAVHRAVHNIQAAGSTGDRLHNCKDCVDCFYINESEHNKYIDNGFGIKDSMDLEAVGPNVVKCYQVSETQESYGIKFGYFINASRDLEYCYECSDCSNCFGCMGLRKKSFCILNKQHSEEDYWKILDEIKTDLLESGEYGEFFPKDCRMYPYNDTLAMVQFEKTKEQALHSGYSWQDEVNNADPKIAVLEEKEVPDDIYEVTNDILEKAIRCKKSGKLFRITPNELDLYRKIGAPLPVLHPYERLMSRFKRKPPFKLFRYPCAKCKNEMATPFNPNLGLVVWCESCYQNQFS